MPEIKAEFVEDDEASMDQIETEQWYWNFVDGELFCPISVGEREVTVMFDSGAVEMWHRRNSVFEDDALGEDIVPVKLDSVGSS